MERQEYTQEEIEMIYHQMILESWEQAESVTEQNVGDDTNAAAQL